MSESHAFEVSSLISHSRADFCGEGELRFSALEASEAMIVASRARPTGDSQSYWLGAGEIEGATEIVGDNVGLLDGFSDGSISSSSQAAVFSDFSDLLVTKIFGSFDFFFELFLEHFDFFDFRFRVLPVPSERSDVL